MQFKDHFPGHAVNYAAVSFPFAPVQIPVLRLRCTWSMQQLLENFLCWAATRRYVDSEHCNPLELVRAELTAAWDDAPVRAVSWPLSLNVSRK